MYLAAAGAAAGAGAAAAGPLVFPWRLSFFAYKSALMGSEATTSVLWPQARQREQARQQQKPWDEGALSALQGDDGFWWAL